MAMGRHWERGVKPGEWHRLEGYAFGGKKGASREIGRVVARLAHQDCVVIEFDGGEEDARSFAKAVSVKADIWDIPVWSAARGKCCYVLRRYHDRSRKHGSRK